ncbi:COG1361 S-layer family protein [Halobellus ordinarius]|uniref:COG1361 S-layer family protein n=1 Tax=Halobellus ordinarius TaxID=3075120 RepID=UPI0028805B39|nr:NEW3 domain-containing protein [Halobellus sp. ZY16]
MRIPRFTAAVIALLVVLSIVPMPIGAIDRVTGSPDISLQGPQNTFAPGQEVSLPVYVSNDGSIQESGPLQYVERVTTARAVTLDVRSGNSPVEVQTGTYPVGNVPEGTAGPFEISLTIPENTTPGTYRLPVRVKYSYTPTVKYGSGTDGPEFRNTDRVRTRWLKVVVRDQPRFEVTDVSSSVRVGGADTVAVTVENRGTEPAREATLRLRSVDDEISLGTGAVESRAYSQLWRPGKNRTFEFRTRVASDAVRREYPLVTTVSYTDMQGVPRTSRELTAGVEPLEEVSFTIDNLSSSLYVGEPGTIRGTVTNTGPTAVDNAVVVYTPSNPHVTPITAETALGRLDPGETRDFEFEVEVDNRTTPGTQQLNLSVQYRDSRRNRYASEPLEPSVPVRPEREWLSVTPENATFGIDSDNRLTVRVQNVEDVPLSDVRARLHVDDPFSSESRGAYIGELEPEETTTLAFAVTVSEDAVVTQSSVSMTVTAERPDGETITLDTYVVPVVVAEDASTDDTIIFAVGSLLAVVVLILGWWWLQK